MKTVLLVSFGYLLLLLPAVLHAQSYVWAKSPAGMGSDNGQSIALDASGNVYSTGHFQSTVDFDPGTGTANLTSSGNDDIFVLKLNSSGDYVWAKKIGGSSFDKAYSIAVDNNGYSYITGYFTGTVDFDPGSNSFTLSTGNIYWDAFVLKLDPQGNFVWAKQITQSIGQHNEVSLSIAIDASGNVFTTGYFTDSTDFDPGPDTYYLYPDANPAVFVSKLDASGNFVWAFKIGGHNSNSGNAIKTDNYGNVYVAGYFYGTGDFDPGTGVFNLSSVALRDIFVAKYSSTGNFIWAKAITRVTGSYYNEAYALAIDGTGNVLVTGSFSGTVDFDPGAGTYPVTSSGSNSDDVFVLKLVSCQFNIVC